MTDTSDTTPGTNASPSDWEAKRVVQERLQAELQPRNKAALFDALAAAGVTLVVVTFDGYGDSGQIENVEAKAGDAVIDMPIGEIEMATAVWDQAEPDRSHISIADAIERLAYDFLTDTHCGWENNDGAYGDFTFDVAERTITLDYNERYTASEYSQHVF
ncbi:hypothetical protein HYPDE_40668 [Hyphomicrobium denitrificans 1NES1]|uniref:DUF6878 domain-containing protein n=1 Tax=Hyphomicrobium denitrificans 1NES1 TaxID=670307 RepID=N0BC06_9HYPH|nr:DUF6878 family protein [Hyphomicrobium denitrificans]AGK59802.1 hypothetical protein HYPDE_40668 [Hyphomicrobium denitrificans 1NES1]